MTLLLDSNALLWLFVDDARLGPQARTRIASESDLCISDLNLFEISIKAAKGRLTLPPKLTAVVDDLGIRRTGLHDRHLDTLRRLPFHHKDPFDRYLIAQSLADSIPVLTADGVFAQYGVQVIDARL